MPAPVCSRGKLPSLLSRPVLLPLVFGFKLKGKQLCPISLFSFLSLAQVRRKALQEEIDRESGKTEVSEPKKWTGTQFGQWDTAGFENEEQKLKFLKLMGGFKNVSPSLSRPPNTTGRPNVGLNKKAAIALQQNLQQDYDQAMSWKYKHGAGLGFSSTPDKIFYIDRNASKSIKFED